MLSHGMSLKREVQWDALPHREKRVGWYKIEAETGLV